MKKINLIFAICAFAFLSCKKEVVEPVSAPVVNDVSLLGKWYLDSTISPDLDMVYWNRNCNLDSAVSSILFTGELFTDYTCLYGNEYSFESKYKTVSGIIATDVDTFRYYFNQNRLVVVNSYSISQSNNDSVYSWYSR